MGIDVSLCLAREEERKTGGRGIGQGSPLQAAKADFG